MKEVKFDRKRDKVRFVKKLLTSVGNRFGAVTFLKREDGSKRKMCYRLHTMKPTYAKSPSKSKVVKADNALIVFDVNKITYDKKGFMNGRGAFRTIPLENVIRAKVNGEIYKIS